MKFSAMAKAQIAVSVALASTSLAAHHSRAHFGTDIHEISGRIVDFRWQNPHVLFRVETTGDSDERVIWDVEGGSIYMMGRSNGITEDMFNVGDEVLLAGQISQRTPNLMLVFNMLLPGGQEAITMPDAPQRWANRDTVSNTAGAREILADNPERSLFRVWSNAPLIAPTGPVDRSTLAAILVPPLTPEGEARLADYDPEIDDPLLRCEKPGMPSAMFNPHPFAFTDMGDYIRVDIQENDVTRRIWMVDNEKAAANMSLLGYSRGRWEDGNLVVQTTGINNPYFNRAGVPITENVVVDERFEISEDGSRLAISVTTTDPVTLLDPVTIVQHLALLGETLHRFDCVSNDEGGL